MRPWTRLAPVIALAIIVLVPLWRAVFAGQAIGEFDPIRHMPPWNGPAASQPWDVLEADSVLQFYPWRHMVLDAWSKGQLPLWNPYELAGTPLLANSQSGGFYPPHVVLGLLHVPVVPAITLLAWFHLTWAALGVYALSRRLGAGRVAAIVGGASFALSPFMLDWLALASVPSTVAWIPWCLVAVHLLLNDSQKLRATATLAFCLGMMILAGHLQFAAYGVLAVVLFALLLAVLGSDRRKAVSLPLCVAGLALGGALAAAQLLPVLSFSKLSPRQNTASATGYDDYVKKAIQPFELANLTVANGLGSPREVGTSIQGQILASYWPPLAKSGANLAESAVTIGPLVLGLLFLAPWKRRETWAVAIIGVVALLLALGTPLNAVLYYGVPGWSATGSPGRIAVLFVMCACVLAALGLDRAGELNPKLKIVVFAAPLVVGGLFAALLPGLGPDAGQAEQVVSVLRGAATSEALITVLISSVLAMLALAIAVLPQAAKYRRALPLFPVLIAWVCYASNLVPTGTPLPMEAGSDQARVAVINSDWQISVYPNALFPPNTASLSGLHELGGYDSLLSRDAHALLDDIDGPAGAAPPANGNILFVKPSYDKSKLADAGVTKIYALSTGDANGFVTQELAGPGRISATGGSATITDDGYDHQTLSLTPGTMQVVERDFNLPGWEIDGRPIPGSPWRTIDVGGPHTKLELRYNPPGLHTGMILTAIASLVLLALIFIRLRNP